MLEINKITVDGPINSETKILLYWGGEINTGSSCLILTLENSVIKEEGNKSGDIVVLGKYFNLAKPSCCQKCAKNTAKKDWVVCIEVFAKTETRRTREGGWITVAQGELYSLEEETLTLRNEYFIVEGVEPHITVRVTYKGGTGGRLPFQPQLSEEEQDLIEEDLRIFNSLPKLIGVNPRAHQRVIANHVGQIPRQMFYWPLRVPITLDFAYSIVDTGFLCHDANYKLNETPTIEEWHGMMRGVLTILSRWISNEIDYQEDSVDLVDGTKVVFECFSKNDMIFKDGDCEDLAWWIMAILNAIKNEDVIGNSDNKEKQKTVKHFSKMLKNYVITNALVQSAAPQMAAGGKPGVKPAKEVDEEKDNRASMEFPSYHMTCILYPIDDFIECYNRANKTNLEIPKLPFKLNRLEVEGTACLFPDPDEEAVDLPIATRQHINTMIQKEDVLEQPFCAPVGNNLLEAGCCYGAVLELATDHFFEKDRCLFLYPVIEESPGKFFGAPLDSHWQSGKYGFKKGATIMKPLEKKLLYEPPIPILDYKPIPGERERFKQFLLKNPTESIITRVLSWVFLLQPSEIKLPLPGKPIYING